MAWDLHTISVPRIKKADDIDPSAFDNGIDDDTFAKIIACIRISVPYTGMIISTRESQACREKVIGLGISQISGGSKTSVGGYAEPELPEECSEQFDVSDTRTLDQVVSWLIDGGYIPSFCTACYREGQNRRPVHVSLQERTDLQLLSAECLDDTAGIPDRLCFSGNESKR